MRALTVAAAVLLSSSLAVAETPGGWASQKVKLVSRSAPASSSWNQVVDQLRTVARDKPLRAALRANHGSIVLGKALVPDRRYPGVATLRQLVMTGGGLVVRSRIGNHVETGDGQATFLALPKAHYEGSTAVRFSRFGIPFFTERLRPGEWGHLSPEAIRAAAFSYKLTSAKQEAQRYLDSQGGR